MRKQEAVRGSSTSGAHVRGTAILVVLVCLGCARTEPKPGNPPEAREIKSIESLDITLPKPSSEADATYLGLEGYPESFQMGQIKARVLVVEVFDMYCRFCQGAAPKVDALYEINLRSGFGDELKLIGIGRMNTELEVATFRDKYKVRFPLFADKDLSISRALEASNEGTPHFIVIRKSPADGVKVVYRSTGAFEDPKAYHDVILERSGLKKE
jgi:AhpC/TSA family